MQANIVEREEKEEQEFVAFVAFQMKGKSCAQYFDYGASTDMTNRSDWFVEDKYRIYTFILDDDKMHRGRKRQYSD